MKFKGYRNNLPNERLITNILASHFSLEFNLQTIIYRNINH